MLIIASKLLFKTVFILILLGIIYNIPVFAVEVRIMSPEEEYQSTSCETNEVVFIISDSLCELDTTQIYFSIINRNEGETLYVSPPSSLINLVWIYDSLIAMITIPESLRGTSGDTIGVVCDSVITICDTIPEHKIYIADCNNDRIVRIDDMAG
ncbi:hypothetical protein DRQ29_05435, partial [bacterium]